MLELRTGRATEDADSKKQTKEKLVYKGINRK